MKDKFGEILKNIRKQAGLSQAEFAEKLGVHMQTVSRWERNTSEPDMSMYEEISKTLSVPLEKLWGVPIPEKPVDGHFDLTALGKAIYTERKKLGERQEELASVACVSSDTVSKWERGLICPDIDTFLVLAEHFGVFPSELYYSRSAEKTPTAVAAPGPKPSRKKASIIAACASMLVFVLTAVILGVCLFSDSERTGEGPEENKTVCLHEYIEERTEATCLAAGYVTKVCTKCGHRRRAGYIEKLEHTVGDWVIDREPTCTDAGSKHTACTVCHTAVESSVIEKLGHDYTDTLVPPEGDTAGYYLCTCERCGDSYKANADLKFDFLTTAISKTCTLTGIEETTATEIVIPATVNGHKVTAIDARAFYSTKISKIVMPDSVTYIGKEAFAYCIRLTEIDVPDGVTFIGDKAFYGCTRLTRAKLPERLTVINGMFSYCGALETVNIPRSVTTIKEEAFRECGSLKRVVLPEGLSTIESHAFYKCEKLEEIIIPDSVTEIRYSVFKGCKSLQRAVLPEGLPSIESYVFSQCEKLEEINIPDSVTRIGGYAFEGCKSLKRVVLPEGLWGMEASAFSQCEKLEEINIPESVTTIGSHSFEGCKSLVKVQFGRTDGWTVRKYGTVNPVESAVYGEILADAKTAAEILTTAYCEYFCYRK